MEMNDILNGLNPCDDNCCDSGSDNCGCGGQMPGNGFPGAACLGNGGFCSWIWILLILFYCGCGGNGLMGGNNCGCCNCGCKGGSLFGGNSCTAYLFLLVILFLCNGGVNNRASLNNCGC
ncbi:MAG: hypothetical protein E7207_00165 [Clostridium butyricum]|nr:hypothetical protein [Clostridium butyricum]